MWHIPSLPPDSKTQMEMFRQAEDKAHARMRLFNEIMTGPNPLTPEECARMAAKRPEYAFMATFGPKPQETP